MKKTALKGVVAVFIILSGIISCSDSESRLSPLLRQTTVILNIGLPPENPSAYDNTIWNKIRRFFVPDAIAQTAPATFSSILVRVTGADFGVMEQTFGPSGTISLSVPSGSFRQFEVIATVAPGDPSAALSFRGTTAANLPAGETVSVPVIMGLNETKLIAPDYNNERIVILNSITGPYTSRDGDGLGLSSTMSPYDLDFDSRGRIYIADSNYRIIRVDSLNGGNLTYFSLGGEYTPIAVAVDRNNNIVYASSYSQLWKGPLNGSLSSLDPDSLYSIYGMDVGSDGMLYIAGARSTDSTEGIYKYDPTEQRVVGQYTSGGDVGTIYDVQVKFPFIFALNPSPPSENQNYRILQLQIGQNNTIDLVGHGLDTGIGTLNNAGHFTAIINSGLLIMESYPNQLIFIQDVNGTGWQVNTGSGEFDFYDYAEGG